MDTCRFDQHIDDQYWVSKHQKLCYSRFSHCQLTALSLSFSSSLPTTAKCFVRPNPSISLRITVALQPVPSLFRCPSPRALLSSGSILPSKFSRAAAPRDTCHIHQSVLTFVGPDPQLAFPVIAPALDPAPDRDRARVSFPRGYGDGGETCDGMWEWGWG